MGLALLDINRAAAIARANDPNDPEAIELLDSLRDRKLSVESDMAYFSGLCDRWDNLYYPQGFTAGGASHWASHRSARLPGRAHVSLNVYPTYVDVPAALQSVPPIENMVAREDNEDTRRIAAATERIYRAWKEQTNFELVCHKACVVKGLYGRTAVKVYWDEGDAVPKVELVDNPRNLYLGWRNSQYSELEWAVYTYRITPDTALEDWGVMVMEGKDPNGDPYPYVVWPTGDWSWRSSLMTQADLQVEVYDYWYRRPAEGARPRFGKPMKFETWNAIFVGNVLVKNKRHREYRGKLPYVPIFNTYLPGLPEGRSDLYDIEQVIREKDERLSENAQVISRAVNGQYWQLTGPDSPTQVPSGLKPVAGQVVAPGPGNRIESIDPWMPEFQLEQFLGRLDRELVDVSGLNDLLRGLAPAQVLDSAKAIAVLVANYEMRIRMKRDLYYAWRIEVWDLCATLWAEKNSKLKPVIEGKSRLELKAPSLTPRDDGETATIASNLVAAKLMSMKRAMDKVGIDDPETELDIIRDEMTDATIHPAEVQVMAQLLGILRQQGIQPQQEVQQTVEAQAGALADVRALAGGQTGQPQFNAEGEQPLTPPEQMPGNTPEGAALGAGGIPPGAPLPGGEDLTLQTAIRGGEANSRILQQQRLTTQTERR